MPELQDGRDDQEQRWQEGDRVLAEVMVAPASRMSGLNLRRIGFRHKTHCVVMGIQRRSRMMRQRITEIPLEEGDVLLVQGQQEDIDALRRHDDIVLLEWSAEELPALDHAKRAVIIFFGVILLAATGILPVMVSALIGAAALVATGVLGIRAAARSLDSKIFTMIPAALAMGLAMQVTGGASYLAQNLIDLLQGASGPVVLSAFFLLIAALSNIISAKAAAVLFTPIAVGVAQELNVPVEAFAVAVVFAANCAVADAHRLSDQSAGHGAGALYVCRFRPGRHSVDHCLVGGVQPVCALVLRLIAGSDIGGLAHPESITRERDLSFGADVIQHPAEVPVQTRR